MALTPEYLCAWAQALGCDTGTCIINHTCADGRWSRVKQAPFSLGMRCLRQRYPCTGHSFHPAPWTDFAQHLLPLQFSFIAQCGLCVLKGPPFSSTHHELLRKPRKGRDFQGLFPSPSCRLTLQPRFHLPTPAENQLENKRGLCSSTAQRCFLCITHTESTDRGA